MDNNLEDMMEIRINNLPNHENPKLYYNILYADISAMKPLITRAYFMRRLEDEYRKYKIGMKESQR
ncbi:MAG: hypothetical protein AABY22_28285 [Nanoarchaeota archaeon]